VSLVLEALKKLDREKGRDERGFVVMAAAPWPTRAARRWPAWAALGIATAGAIAAVLALRATPAPAPAPAPRPAPPAAATAVVEPAPAAVVTPHPPARVVATVAPPVAEPVRRETPAAAPSPMAPRAAEPQPRLQAISERDGQPIAIINDHLVRVGDEVDGIRVLAIRGAEVDVEVRGRRTTLRF
jgi:hypothetical protein